MATEAKEFSYSTKANFPDKTIADQITEFLKDTVGSAYVDAKYSVLEVDGSLEYYALLIYTV